MLVRRATINAALAATTADDTQYFLDAIQIEPDGKVVATNGFVLLIATDKAPVADEDFPLVAGIGGENITAPIVVPSDIARRLIAATPKRETLPVLSTIKVSANGEQGKAVLAATDLTVPVVIPIDSTDKTFPIYARVIPDSTRPVLRFVLSVDILQALISATKAVRRPGAEHGGMITFALPADETHYQKGTLNSALTASISGLYVDVDAVVMPCRP